MPRMKTETSGTGDMTWLASTHGIRNARTEILDISAFTKATHYPDGYIKSGTPVALVGGTVVGGVVVGGLLVPYDVTVGTTTGAGVLAGHILTDQLVVGTDDFPVPLHDQGRVRVASVPYAAFAKPIAAKSATTIVYV